MKRSRLKKSAGKKRKRLKAEIKYKIEAVPNPYGFGRDWHLLAWKERSGKTVSRVKRFMLGQDVKVCYRALGAEPKYLADEAEKKFGTRNFDDPRVNKWLADQIIMSMTGSDDLERAKEKMFGAQPWELSVQ